ncbi:MAG: Ig-like domain-containing protein, partial [Bacteroidales bacterium]|nr:Ig-like domain-containing protein [Bacteroidales bacterium]
MLLQGGGGTLPPSDTTPPTLDSSIPIDDSASFLLNSNIILTFSENVQAGSGNIVISNGTDTRTISVTDSSQVTISGNTVTINPTTDLTEGTTYHITMASGVIKDMAGNNYAGISDTTTLNFTTTVADTTAPGVTINDDEAGTGNIAGGDITYTFTFDEPVTGFAIGDITVANGTKGTFTAVSSTVYTLVVTPTAGFEGNVTVDVAAGVAVDAANNGNTAATGSVQAVDMKAPGVTITDDEAGTGNIAGGDITYTFTFDEPVTGFAIGDITVANGTKGTFTAVSSTVYTLVVTPTAGFEGNVTVDVAAGV